MTRGAQQFLRQSVVGSRGAAFGAGVAGLAVEEEPRAGFGAGVGGGDADVPAGGEVEGGEGLEFGDGFDGGDGGGACGGGGGRGGLGGGDGEGFGPEYPVAGVGGVGMPAVVGGIGGGEDVDREFGIGVAGGDAAEGVKGVGHAGLEVFGFAVEFDAGADGEIVGEFEFDFFGVIGVDAD